MTDAEKLLRILEILENVQEQNWSNIDMELAQLQDAALIDIYKVIQDET